LLSPAVAERLQRYLHAVITRRALWRLAHGVQVPRVKSIVRFAVAAIPFWRLFGKPAQALVDISPDEIEKTPKFLLFTGTQRFPFTLVLANALTILTFLTLFTHDWLSTVGAKVAYALRRKATVTKAAEHTGADRGALSASVARAAAPPD
jgi:hypothetical protein